MSENLSKEQEGLADAMAFGLTLVEVGQSICLSSQKGEFENPVVVHATPNKATLKFKSEGTKYTFTFSRNTEKVKQ